MAQDCDQEMGSSWRLPDRRHHPAISSQLSVSMFLCRYLYECMYVCGFESIEVHEYGSSRWRSNCKVPKNVCTILCMLVCTNVGVHLLHPTTKERFNKTMLENYKYNQERSLKCMECAPSGLQSVDELFECNACGQHMQRCLFPMNAIKNSKRKGRKTKLVCNMCRSN